MTPPPENQRGDTLVSILLSLAVLGVLTAVIWSLLGSGLKQARSSEVHSDNSALAVAQLEKVKWAAVHQPELVFSNQADLCDNSDLCLEGAEVRYLEAGPDGQKGTPDDYLFAVSAGEVTYYYRLHPGQGQASAVVQPDLRVTVSHGPDYTLVARSNYPQTDWSYRQSQPDCDDTVTTWSHSFDSQRQLTIPLKDVLAGTWFCFKAQAADQTVYRAVQVQLRLPDVLAILGRSSAYRRANLTSWQSPGLTWTDIKGETRLHYYQHSDINPGLNGVLVQLSDWHLTARQDRLVPSLSYDTVTLWRGAACNDLAPNLVVKSSDTTALALVYLQDNTNQPTCVDSSLTGLVAEAQEPG